MRSDSGEAHLGLAMVLIKESFITKAIEELHLALTWLPPTSEGMELRSNALAALAGLQWAVQDRGAGDNNKLYEESLQLFDLAFAWIEGSSSALKVEILMKRAIFCTGEVCAIILDCYKVA